MTELWKANIRLSTSPWESRRRREIPTFPQLRRRVVLLERKRTQKEKTEGRLHKTLDTADFAGFLVRHGWGIYHQFAQALHQTCLSYLLRRHREIILVPGRGEAEFPRTIESILQQSLQLRNRHAQGQISEQGLAVSRGKLETRLDRTLQRHYRSPRNRRLANHLLRERDALFTFLSCPGLEATNWRAERAIRPKLATKAEACGCIKGCLRPPCHLVDSYAPRRSLAYQNM